MTPFDDKPFSAACERNQQPIAEQLTRLIEPPATLLEIGAGTGQHAVYCAAALPTVTWLATDRAEHLSGINRWIAEADLPNLPPAQALDVGQPNWPVDLVDYVFSANTAHIMDWSAVGEMFAGVAARLRRAFFLYGPFNYDGGFTSAGNRQLDAWARATFAGGGLRDFEQVCALAHECELGLLEDVAMPANNRLLVFAPT